MSWRKNNGISKSGGKQAGSSATGGFFALQKMNLHLRDGDCDG